jgi:hypothetical protein
MYRRPILCTLYGAVDFLNGHEELHYVPVDDGWEEVLGCNVYITSQNWDIMYTLRPSTGT